MLSLFLDGVDRRTGIGIVLIHEAGLRDQKILRCVSLLTV